MYVEKLHVLFPSRVELLGKVALKREVMLVTLDMLSNLLYFTVLADVEARLFSSPKYPKKMCDLTS